MKAEACASVMSDTDVTTVDLVGRLRAVHVVERVFWRVVVGQGEEVGLLENPSLKNQKMEVVAIASEAVSSNSAACSQYFL